jgi:hypothetical protein
LIEKLRGDGTSLYTRRTVTQLAQQVKYEFPFDAEEYLKAWGLNEDEVKNLVTTNEEAELIGSINEELTINDGPEELSAAANSQKTHS